MPIGPHRDPRPGGDSCGDAFASNVVERVCGIPAECIGLRFQLSPIESVRTVSEKCTNHFGEWLAGQIPVLAEGTLAVTKTRRLLFLHIAPPRRARGRAAGAGKTSRSAVVHWTIRLGLFWACALGPMAPGYAQTPSLLDRPDVDVVDGGTVYASARLPDGSLVFGGEFRQIDGAPRRSLFKRRPDGTLDPDWNPAVDGPVYALAADAAGHVYVGGYFTTLGGQVRRSLAKLSGEGSGAVDADWNPSPNGDVVALAIDANGDVYAGGYFTIVGGRTRRNLAKLSGDGFGAADADWDPSPDDNVSAIALDANGDLFVGGDFDRIGAQSHPGVAKLSTQGAGVVDAAWRPLSDTGPRVSALALDGDGNLFVGGSFESIGGFARGHLAKLSTAGSGAVDPNWDPSADASVQALAVDASGALYAGGGFRTIGGLPRLHLAKLSRDGVGAVDPAWNPAPDDGIEDIAIDADGKTYVGGGFRTLAGSLRLGFAAVQADGTADAAMDAEWPGVVHALAHQADGGTIVGGEFRKADGHARRNLFRLRADGTVDPDWNPLPNGRVNAIATDADGVYIGGRFDTVDEQPRMFIAKLSGGGTGALDPQWNPSFEALFNGYVDILAIHPNGNLYAAGDFLAVGGFSRHGLVKLSTAGSGTVDPNWNPSPDFFVAAMVLDARGDLYVGGNFGQIGGAFRQSLAKLAGDGVGAADPAWQSSSDGGVYALAMDAAGDVFAGGDFGSIGGQARRRLAKLSGSGTGTVDPNWNPSADSAVYALAVDAAGDVYAGGDFDTIGGSPRTHIAKLSGSGTGAADPEWKPLFAIGNPDARERPDVNGFGIDSQGNVWVGGSFWTIDGEPRVGIAAFGSVSDVLFIDGFDSSSVLSIATEG